MKIIKALQKRVTEQVNSKGLISRIGWDEYIHDLRGKELKRLSLDGEKALHIGCSGDWYFNWVAEKLSHTFALNIGIEKYSEKPASLPVGTKWISSCAGLFVGVEDHSIDWVYSGQNIEHLWEDDFVDFWKELARVVKVGGTVSLDTPNVGITEKIAWNHPQHVAEFSPNELKYLFELAGFDVLEIRGLHKVDFRFIPAEKVFLGYKNRRVERKSNREAARDPENSFIFWINAKRSNRGVSELLTTEAENIFRRQSLNRLNRLQDANWKRVPYIESSFRLPTEIARPLTMCIPLSPGKHQFKAEFVCGKNLISKIDLEFNGGKLEFKLNKHGNFEASQIVNLKETNFGAPIKIDFPKIPQELTAALFLKSSHFQCHRSAS